MKIALLVAATLACILGYAMAYLNGTYCCDRFGCPRVCEMSPDNAENADNAGTTFAVPAEGFVPNANSKTCFFNCEWFIRTAKRSDPSKPCQLQRGRNGKFRSDCVQEQICSSCSTGLVMNQRAWYLNAEDTAPRCPKLPEDLDAFTTEQLNTAIQICQRVAKCKCVSGPINPNVVSVRE